MTEEKQDTNLTVLNSLNKQIVIISPHPDDELIGCFNVLNYYKDFTKHICYTCENLSSERRQEAMKLKDHFSVHQHFQLQIPPKLLDHNNIFFAPDPHNECHFEHRKIGFEAEQFARIHGFDVVFYTVQKNTPYVYEVSKPDEKEKVLNSVYPSQTDLWQYEKKYILFEGYKKYLFY